MEFERTMLELLRHHSPEQRPEDRNARAPFNTVDEGIESYNELVAAARDQQQREQRQYVPREHEHNIQTPIHIENERRGPRL